MSLRRLYRSIPVQARICVWCQEPILRNIDQDKDGRLYHHGCLLTAKETFYECLECFANFDGTEATFIEGQSSFNDEYRQTRQSICPHCGSSNLKGQGRIQAGVIET